jgi:type I restriction enzyme S subunit
MMEAVAEICVGEWRSIALVDVCDDVQYGVTASASAKSPHGPLLLRITDIVPPRIDWRTVPACDLPEQKVKRFELRDGDIVVARTGATVGYAKQIKEPPERAVFASYLVRFRVSDDVDPAYIGHVVQSSAYKDYVGAHAGGAAQPNASAKVLGRFPVSLPDKSTQRRIAAVLSAFDELIEINERRIELLEGLARSLYREWFVRFRFPGHEEVDLVDSELGPVPEGWEVQTLGDIAAVNDESFKTTDLPDPFLYLDISAVGVGRIEAPSVIAAAEAPGRARRRVRDGDVVWATVRPNRRAHGLIHDPPANLVASTGLVVLSPAAVPSSFLYEHAATQSFTDFLVSQATGSAYPAVRPNDFCDAPVLVPPHATLDRFDAVVDRALRTASALKSQCRQLAATRDLLLPRLVTGRLDISDVDLGVLTPTEAE